MQKLALSAIRIDGGTQPRARIDEGVVADYAAAMKDGAEFPPIVVFHDGVDHWLADGFHRFHANRKNETAIIAVDVRTGTKRDAILFSVGANTSHGARRTNDDKRRAVMTILNDAEWSASMTDGDIANHCGVSRQYVNELRNLTCQQTTSERPARTFTTKHGTVSTMRTENIGSSRKGLRAGHESKETRIEQITELSSKGFRASQIAEKIGANERYVKEFASKHGITLYETTAGRALRIDNKRVIEQTVLGLEASAASLRTIGVSLIGITKDDAEDWVRSLNQSIRAFSALRKQLTEHANGKD